MWFSVGVVGKVLLVGVVVVGRFSCSVSVWWMLIGVVCICRVLWCLVVL